MLSNREISAIIWGVAYFLYAMRSSSARKSVNNVFKAFWKAKKALTVLVLLPTFIGISLLGKFININLNACKEILVWIITSALLSYSFEILNIKLIKQYFKLIGQMLSIIPLIWFVVDYTSFSIWWELLIVPVSFFLTKLFLFDELNNKENIDVKKFVNFLYYIFFIVWVYSLYKTLYNPSFWSIETFQTFIISPFLTIVYALLTYPIILIIKYESLFIAINKIIDVKLKAVYRKKILVFCRFNLNKISHCDFYIYNRTEQSSNTLKYTIDSAINSYKRQSNKYEIQNN